MGNMGNMPDRGILKMFQGDNFLKGAFKGPDMPAPAPVPEIPEPTVMPLPDDAAMRKKKRESLRAQQARGGRASTILSTQDKLG